VSEHICVICSQPVSKRKSFQYQNGRACKHHEEAQEVNANKQRAETAKRAAEAKALKRGESRCRETFDWDKQVDKGKKLREWMDTHCWRCGKEGVTRQLFAARMLIGMEKRRLKGDMEVFNVPRQREAAGLAGVLCLTMFRPPRDNKVYEYLKYKVRELASFVGAVQLCPECAKLNGLDFKKAWNPETPELNLKLMAAIGGVYEVSGMKSAVETVAREELRDELMESGK